MKRRLLVAVLAILLILAAGSFILWILTPPESESMFETPTKTPTETPLAPEKPVIYLYPTDITDITVTLDYDGRITVSYPSYPDGGWRVTAYPDGRLIDRADGREYSYLYWEGLGEADYDFSRGFVVKGSDTVAFLQETLAAMGLAPREYNEFIVYWLPRMQNNAFNLIAFQNDAYTDKAKLSIDPEPDSLLRVFMAFMALDHPIVIPPQEFEPFERRGFAVVEWGGADATRPH